MAQSDDPERPGKVPASTIQDAKAELFFGEKPMPSGRFQPGQSGNPNGRPKRAPELPFSLQDNAVHLATLRESRRLVTVQPNGTSTEVSMLDAVVQSQITNAVKGNPLAQRDALLRIERAYQQEAREIADSHEFWSRYRDQQWAEIERAKRNRTPLPNPLPHPDDIVIEPGRPVRVDGPIDEADMALCTQSCLYRDTLLLQQALDERLASAHPGDGYRSGGSLIWAVAFNNLIYKRFQLDENQLIWQSLRNASIPKRELLKKLHRAWQTLGVTAPRGTRFASFEIVEAIVRFGGEITAATIAGDVDRDEFLRREFNDAALNIIERFKARLAA